MLLACGAVTEPAESAEPASSDGALGAADAYRGAVAEIIAGRAADRPYPDDAPQLSIVNSRRPLTVAELAPDEIEQLRAACGDEGQTLPDALADEENEIEAAEVVDADGVLRYRLYGWNYGVGYLFPPSGLEVVAFAAQHDLEHWRLEQRPLFAGMDRATRAAGHGFQQPLHFCWTDDSCWDELAGREPGTVGSEPFLRGLFARATDQK